MKELNKKKNEREKESTAINCINLHSSHHIENSLSYISFQPHFAWVDRTDIEMTMVVRMKSSMYPFFFFSFLILWFTESRMRLLCLPEWVICSNKNEHRGKWKKKS